MHEPDPDSKVVNRKQRNYFKIAFIKNDLNNYIGYNGPLTITLSLVNQNYFSQICLLKSIQLQSFQ